MSTEFTSLFPSTDAEFVRWVLWHYGVRYEEHPNAPLFECVAGGLASHGTLSLKEWFSDNSNAVAEFNESNNTLSYSGGNCYPINIF